MSNKSITDRLKTFADICKETGKNEQDYAVPASATYAEKVIIRTRRCKLIAKAFNGKGKVKLADTKQWKYYPCFRIIPDTDSPGGFRLSFYGSGYGFDGSRFGVRPYLLEPAHSDYVGVQFLAEYEALMQDEAMALLED